MSRFKLMVVVLFFLPNFIFCQEAMDFSKVKTSTSEVKVPGNWQQLNTMDDSGQTYLENKEGVIIAIAQNPKKAYSFLRALLPILRT